MNILCPECGRTWVTISMEHDCWMAGHVKQHTKCFVCREAAVAATKAAASAEPVGVVAHAVE